MYNPQAVIHNLSKANGKGKKKRVPFRIIAEFLQSSTLQFSDTGKKVDANKMTKTLWSKLFHEFRTGSCSFWFSSRTASAKEAVTHKKSANHPSIHPSAKPIVPLHISKQANTQYDSKDRPKTQKQKNLPLHHQLGTESLDSTNLDTHKRNENKNIHPSIEQEEENTKVKVKYVPCLRPQIETWQNPKTQK
jgi:hypothetical protein